VRGHRDSTNTMNLVAGDAEFGYSEHPGAVREPQEAPMVTERQEEPQQVFERRRTYSSSTAYGEFSWGPRRL
jgi:hypothetical protein